MNELNDLFIDHEFVVGSTLFRMYHLMVLPSSPYEMIYTGLSNNVTTF